MLTDRSNFLLKAVLISLIIAVFGVYLYFFSFINKSYTPYYGDEYFYFKNAEGFYSTSSLKAIFTYSGHGSKILGSDAHGPTYPLIYGSIAKIVGWSGLTIPFINIGFLTIAFLTLIRNKNVSKLEKLIQTLLIAGSPITLFYSVTYLTEILQISGAIGLYVIFQRYTVRQNQVDLILIFCYLFLLGSIRSTWFFAFFGMIIFDISTRKYFTSIYLIIGILLPFLIQHYFHESVPNIFSELSKMLENKEYSSATIAIYENLNQNLVYAFTYADGDFYAVQKIWILLTCIISLSIFRIDKVILFGLITLGSTMLFTMILYKNYTWVDLRMYTPMTFFLNLRIISKLRNSYSIAILISLNFLSFILIIPLQQVIINYRTPSKNRNISKEVLNDLKNIAPPLVYIDTSVLFNYKIVDLPILNKLNKPITYILPYYDMSSEYPSHILIEETNHWCVKSIKILSQKIIPENTCMQ